MDTPATEKRTYFAVSPLMIFPDSWGKFKVYVKTGDKFALYTREMELFTDDHRKRLHDYGVKEVWIDAEQRREYQEYVEKNIGTILADESLPLDDRAKVFYDASGTLVAEALDKRLPGSLKEREFGMLQRFVSKSLAFLTNHQALNRMASLISQDFKLYRHSVNVFIYTIFILHTFQTEEDTLVQAGIGALLHDIGKAGLPDRVIKTDERELTARERAQLLQHPARGVAACAFMPLGQQAVNCILLHHEREDGNGYPTGVGGDDVPLAAKVVNVANVYDNLTVNRNPELSLSPFQALKTMREDMPGAFDMEVFKRLVLVLSGAKIVEERAHPDKGRT